MSVDYDGVGGIGVFLDDEKLDKLFATGAISKEDWEELGPDDCFDRLDLPGWTTVGNEAAFREKFAKYGIDIALNDLVVISELYVY